LCLFITREILFVGRNAKFCVSTNRSLFSYYIIYHLFLLSLYTALYKWFPIKLKVMLGTIIGDIVGSRFEYNNTDRTDFDLFTPECSYTDDTICTVAVADAILNGNSYKESLLKWCRKYPDPKGAYGRSFESWIHQKDPKPYNSYGNGSAMRVGPVGWAFDSEKEVLEQAKLTAIISHNHPEGVRGAQCVAALIYSLRKRNIRKRVSDITLFVRSKFGYTIPSLKSLKSANTFDCTCQGTVPQAIRCFMQSKYFEDTIRITMSIGGDSDTLGAIAGSIAETWFDIPEQIKSKALEYLPDDMIEVIDRFTEKFGK